VDLVDPAIAAVTAGQSAAGGECAAQAPAEKPGGPGYQDAHSRRRDSMIGFRDGKRAASSVLKVGSENISAGRWLDKPKLPIRRDDDGWTLSLPRMPFVAQSSWPSEFPKFD
jgi:hypothetical protein